jgi:glycosyltransferase involved in cell wall biosynthesis
MFQGHRIAAVVPAYREEKLIGRVIETMPDLVDHIVVVDDASPDATAEAARAVGDPRVTVLRLEDNRGVGGAVLAGHACAMELGADVNVVMAGDAQMDPDYLPQLLTPVTSGGYGFAKANRFFSSESFSGMPAHRIVGNVLLSFLTKLASGYWHLFDPQNGYTAIRRDVLARLPLTRIARRYSFENDLLVHLNILRVPAVDVPIPAVYGEEVSSIRLRRVVPELVRQLTAGFLRRVWMRYILSSFSPVALFLLVGALFTLVGAAIGAWVFLVTLGPPIATTGSVLLAVVPFLLGAQLLMFALVLDIQESPDEPGAPVPR